MSKFGTVYNELTKHSSTAMFKFEKSSIVEAARGYSEIKMMTYSDLEKENRNLKK